MFIDEYGIEWRVIPGLDGKYYVSEYGNVMNIKTGCVLVDRIDRAGYRELQLWVHSKKITFKIHRLVAMAFIPNPYNLPFVLHGDNNKLNCHVSNLRWGTASENVQQAHDDGISRNPDVRKYHRLYNPETGEEHYLFGMKAVAEMIGYNRNPGVLSACVRGCANPPYRIKNGPYKGFCIETLNLAPAWTYQGVIGYNIGKTFNDHLLAGE